MKFKKTSIMLISFMAALGIVMRVNQKQAAAASNPNIGDEFVVRFSKPAEQKTTEKFFHVQYEPDSTHYIKANILNTSDHKITIKVSVNSAVTGDRGGILYTNNLLNRDKTMKYPFSEIASIPKEDQKVTLQPGDNKIVKAKITTPKGFKEGTVMGNFKFSKVPDKTSATQGIKSKYEYQYGVIVDSIQPKVYPTMQYVSTEPTLSAGYAAYGVTVKNPMPALIVQANISASISKEGLFKKKYFNEVQNVAIAPNSKFSFPISANFDQLKPGTYNVKMRITGKNYWNKMPITWTFNEKIEIDSAQVSKINQQAIKRPTNIWTYAATGSVVLALANAGAYIYFRRKA